MNRFRSRGAVWAGAGLIVITNLALLGAAGWNRRGEPSAELQLTERELAMPAGRRDEGTGLELRLLLTHQAPGVVRRTARWRRQELPAVRYEWLDRAKLVELGFRVDLDPTHPEATHHYAHAIARRVYLAVENDSNAWERWVKGREEELAQIRRDVDAGTRGTNELTDAEALLALDRSMRSRLFPVDAGLDPDGLRRQYPDRRKVAVLAGFVRPKLVQEPGGTPRLAGEIGGLVVDRIQVSQPFRSTLEPFLPGRSWEEVEAQERKGAESGWPEPSPPRYRATLALGRRHEPWLVGGPR